MKKILFFIATILLVSVGSTKASNPLYSTLIEMESPVDSTRLAELDQFWAKLAKTVEEGDFEGYKSLYHKDAIVVFTSGKNKTSMPIAKALTAWKKGFTDTKEGKQKDKVEFRFSQRIGSETTAHETGIFIFSSTDNNGMVKGKYIIHFEMLLEKKDNEWYALMENQKSEGTQEEWDALK